MTKAKMTNVSRDREVRAQQSRMDELRGKHGDVSSRAAELRSSLQSEGEPVSIAVAELLADDEQVQRQRALEQAEQELRAIDQAIAIQQQRLTRAQSEAANQVREAALPEHQKLAADIAAAMRQLDQAMRAEREFRKQFPRRFGCSFSIGPMINLDFQPLYLLRSDGGSRLIHDYLLRLEQHGYAQG